MNMKTKTPGIFIGILFLTGCQNLKEVDTTVYMDPSRPVEERVEALLEQMTLEEKIGQMDIVSEWDQDSIMKAGYYDFGAWIAGQEPEAANLLQSFSEKTRLKIPYLIGMDAAHGYATLQGRTVYPTSVSMAATFNRSLAEQAARKAAAEIRSAGNQSQALEKSINARRSVEDIRLKTTVRVLQTE